MKAIFTKTVLTTLASLGILFSTYAQSGSLIPDSPEYNQAKLNGTIVSLDFISLPTPKNLIQNSPIAPLDADDSCLIPHDPATWTEFTGNDDGSIPISFQFDFNFYGDVYTSGFLNNNGNVTFLNSLAAFTAAGFPITTAMVAPFWGDVDTRCVTCGEVWYFSTPTAFYINWVNVGYFNFQSDKVNSFQLILTDGNDPVIGVGNNAAFYYGDMQWTTGSASSGVNGFGGVAATVGANRGNNTDFFQIGRFDEAGDAFDGPYAENDGIDYLDYQCFAFNLNSEDGENIAPIAQNVSPTTLTACVGEERVVNFLFTGPEQDQTVTVSSEDVAGVQSVLVSNEVAGSTTGTLTLTGLSAGVYNIIITATDNGEPALTTSATVVFNVNGCDEECEIDADQDGICDDVDDCVGSLDALGICNGECEADLDGDGVCDADEIPGCTAMTACNYNQEATEDDGSCILNGTVCELEDGSAGALVDCECTPVEIGDCVDYGYYLADILAGGTTNIYDLDITGGGAAMSLIATSDIEVHIAFNETDKLIYAVSKADGSYRTLDPFTAVWGANTLIGASVQQIVGAAINADGKLLISSQSANTIYEVNLGDQSVGIFDSYSPTLGGDIAFGNDGALYHATREAGGALLLTIPQEVASDILLGSVPALVTGLANTEGGQLIISSVNASSLAVRNYDGSMDAAIALTLDGAPFTTFNGDLASGCASNDEVIEECNYKLYYTNQPVGGSSYSLLEVTLNNDGTATTTSLLAGLPSTHIAITPNGATIFMVGNSNQLRTYDVATNTIVNTIAINTAGGMNVSGAPAAVCGTDGTLYIAAGNKVYTVNTGTGVATQFGPNIAVNGGDLIFAPTGDGGAEELWIITRSDDRLTNVLTGAFITLPATEINGAAILENGNLLVSDGNGAGLFKEISLSDASIVATYETGILLDNGDLAGICTGPGLNDGGDEECTNFSTFYVNHGPGLSGSTLYNVAYSGGNAMMTLETTVPFETHIAYNAEDNVVYLVNASGAFVRSYDPTLNTFLGDLTILGGINQLYAVAYNPADGLLYVGDANDDKVYTVDLVSGASTFYGNAPIEGGDLAIQNGKLYLATRAGNKLYEVIAGGDAVLVGNIPANVNGMAQANNASGLVLANFGATAFTEVNSATGAIVAQYNTMLNGSPFTLVNGDMAAGCGDDNTVVDVCDALETGECYATAVTYIQGTSSTGGMIAGNRTDETNALGAPEGTDNLVFVSLGYGGSITVGFSGAVPNGPGADIRVTETTFNNPIGCATYREYADVSVSQDSIVWYYIGTVCKSANMVDISAALDVNGDAVALECIQYVRVANNDAETFTPDGFDVDGVTAIHNCAAGIADAPASDNATEQLGVLESYPNPTSGPSQVVFATGATGRALLEVYDMNGRNVATLFNQEAQVGQEYRADFDGVALPNGVYIYRLTTVNEIIIDKFMIAK